MFGVPSLIDVFSNLFKNWQIGTLHVFHFSITVCGNLNNNEDVKLKKSLITKGAAEAVQIAFPNWVWYNFPSPQYKPTNANFVKEHQA